MMSGGSFFDEPKENSRVKAEIVSKYFWVWANIIGKQDHVEKVGYIDLFAGPGRYGDDTKSTPLFVLEQAIRDPVFNQKLVTIFNDADKAHADSLAKAISALPGIKKLKFEPQIANIEVGEKLTEYLESIRLIPSLCFVDPFGYKGLSLRLINALVRSWASECLFFFNYNRINMGMSNDLVERHMNALFEARAEPLRSRLAAARSAHERELAVIEELTQSLKDMGGQYVLPFKFGVGNRTSHHLIFVTKHVLGYRIMKEIMAGQSSTRDQGVASFEFNAADKRFPNLFELSRPLDDLEGLLLEKFAGRTMSVEAIFDAHQVGTPYIIKNYQDALRNLEVKGAITVDRPATKRQKRNGVVTFAKTLVVTFPPR